jgi:hypothetical protein
MSIAWLDYLVLAEALLPARTTFALEEACCWTAISRAYYAVYGAAHPVGSDAAPGSGAHDACPQRRERVHES